MKKVICILGLAVLEFVIGIVIPHQFMLLTHGVKASSLSFGQNVYVWLCGLGSLFLYAIVGFVIYLFCYVIWIANVDLYNKIMKKIKGKTK